MKHISPAIKLNLAIPFINMDQDDFLQNSKAINDIASRLNQINFGFTRPNDQSESGKMQDKSLSMNEHSEHEYLAMNSGQAGLHASPMLEAESIFLNDECNAQMSNLSDLDCCDVNGRTLIVTNVDYSVYTDNNVQQTFESLFRIYDQYVEFKYLKSFRRVRLDFTNAASANLSLKKMRQYKLGNSIFRCYMAQIIKPDTMNTKHLILPKMTRQFLISPPASPPENWQPISEDPPVIDVQLISALANLVPGQMHEIHPATGDQPGIFVQVCEDIQYPCKDDVEMMDSESQDSYISSDKGIYSSTRKIPQTPRPRVKSNNC